MKVDHYCIGPDCWCKDNSPARRPEDDDPPCPRCGMTAQVEASRSEPGRWMCHGCAQTFASPSDGGGA